jgi:SSS family solute:Na+ symporter
VDQARADLYVAFDVRDDVIYGVDTERWLPPGNPSAHELTPQGWPWFGDGVRLLVNARHEWRDADGETSRGDGGSWQMVASTHKSRLDGLGGGGLLEGEAHSLESAWDSYRAWIHAGAMATAVRVKDRASEGSGYVVEWKIEADPCLEVEPGVFWSPALGEVWMGLNMAVDDLDGPDRATGDLGSVHHEQWWAGERGKRTWLKQWGTMVLVPTARPDAVDPNPPGTIRLTPVADLPLRPVAVQVPEAFRDAVPESECGRPVPTRPVR